MMKSVTLRINGRVQGVGFRYHTRHKALEHGINGFVRNEPDGTVFVAAEGDDELLDQFIEWCKTGPRLARVDCCKITPVENQGFQEFQVI